MTIYTGRGDDGQTDRRDLSRVSKSIPRIEAYGAVDEANALIGTVQPTGYDNLDGLLETVQNHLHVMQADLASPDPDPTDPQVEPTHVETAIDGFDGELAQSEILTETAVTYLNRVLDLCFTLGRVANTRDGEPEASPTY